MKKSYNSVGAFTLIELLTVIAIIGILAAIIIPTVGAVRISALQSKTKVQLTQWGSAVELFKQEYGYYPIFPDNRVNGSMVYNSTTVSGDNKYFQEVLSGRGLGGGTPATFVSADAAAHNRKRMSFYSFSDTEITSAAKGDPSTGAVRDAFGNVEIAVYVDRNGDGLVNATDAAWTGVRSLDEAGSGTPEAADVKAGVIFYSPGKGGSTDANAQTKLVKSWE